MFKATTNPPKNADNAFERWFEKAMEKLPDVLTYATLVLGKVCDMFLGLICKVLAGAVIFVFMAGLVPELREALPNFYQFVDFLVMGLEYISTIVVNIIQQVF